MSNIRAITGSTRIMNRPSGGGSKLQGIPSSTNLNTWSHVAFRNRNIVCACNRTVIFCMNQLGGVGAGGIPGRSYAFAPGADGISRNLSICQNSYCKELHNITLTNEELLFLANMLYDNNSTNKYFLSDFYGYPPSLVRKLEKYKKLYLEKSKKSNMNLNQFYNLPLNNNNTDIVSYSFIMNKISNDKLYKYNVSVINVFENIIDTIDTADDKRRLTAQQTEFVNDVNNEINFWKEIFRYLHWYICK